MWTVNRSDSACSAGLAVSIAPPTVSVATINNLVPIQLQACSLMYGAKGNPYYELAIASLLGINYKFMKLSLPYGELILRNENFKVFTDFALSSKF